MLAVIQHNQHVLVLQGGRDPWCGIRRDHHRQPERCGHRHGNEGGIVDRAEVYKTNAVQIRGAQRVGCAHGHGSLADAAGADDGHEAALAQLMRERRNNMLATNHTRQRRGQVVDVLGGQVRIERLRPRRVTTGDRCNEPIPMPRHVLHVAAGGASVAQRSTERGDMNPERTFFNDRIRPDPLAQLVLFDDLAGTLDQCDENLTRAAA